ncbi:MAG: hypothetical protein K9J37_02845 [Saprospiraceae bacterium]|nr:hypothetical protein [Saprospiraceae bacterium]MCF8248819.1 hypothetical protein [Saprospiraceae bacterium]MCF8279890.1 hypothetical protein [Bacteroidales bacterium]MCF8310104.1 hypothetical protein [Saprospiraceae bacterium]MCF8439004.1 hypothetical protein [Saprospiraceae bacterium]
MKIRTSFIFLALTAISMAGCVNKANQSSFKCGRLLSDKELEELSKTSFKDYQAEDLAQLAELTNLVNEMVGDSLEHEVFFREKTATSLAIEIFGVEAPLQIEKTACEIFSNRELNLPKNRKILFHKYLNGGASSEFLIGVANKKN